MSGQSSLSSTLRFSRRAARGATAFLVTLVAVTACDDPNKPETWIKRLRDPEHAVEAVRRLEKMGDPVAVEPLCKLFEDYPHTSILKAIISFKDKRSIPTLRKALDFSDENQYHNSTKAAHALAEMGVGEAVPDLIKVMQKPLPIKSRANLAKQAAIEALAKLGDKRAVPALIEVADAQPDKQDFHLNKVAVVALGKLGDPAAIPVLIRSLFKGSRLQGSSFSQATVALVRFGDAAVEPLIRAMKGEDKQLNRFAEGLSTPLRPGELLSKTASVLGDLRASKAVPALLAALRSGRQAEDEASKAGLEGVLIALGKIRDTRAVGPLLALIQDAKADARLRIKTARALTALGDPSAVPVLSALAESGYLEGGLWDLRVDAVMAYSRIVGKRAGAGRKDDQGGTGRREGQHPAGVQAYSHRFRASIGARGVGCEVQTGRLVLRRGVE
jgi:HEAT repeat protein